MPLLFFHVFFRQMHILSAAQVASESRLNMAQLGLKEDSQKCTPDSANFSGYRMIIKMTPN